MNHIQLSIEASQSDQEILISELSDMGAVGFEQTDSLLLVYFEEDNFQSYDVKQLLNPFSYQTTTVKQQNWNEEWEKNFEPVVVADFCAVRAHFHQPITSVTYEIVITPKMSFGTGHHATTYMMMEQMRHIDFEGKKVFDFGTGTGILAILAEKLGATQIEATDNDEWSINNATENIEQNSCANINLYLSAEVPTDEFDIIVANINKNVILANLPALHKALIPGGTILLSGLLTTDERDILEACQQFNLQLVKKEEQTNWISLRLIKA